MMKTTDFDGIAKEDIVRVEARDNIVGRVIRPGEVGAPCLDYLRKTEKDDSEEVMGWARRKVKQIKRGHD